MNAKVTKKTAWKQTGGLVQTVDFSKMFKNKKKKSPEKSL